MSATPLPAAALAELSEAVDLLPGPLEHIEADRAICVQGGPCIMDCIDYPYARAIVLLRNSAASLLAEVAASRKRIEDLERALLHAAHRNHPASEGCDGCIDVGRALAPIHSTPEPSHD
jgi:hypothetical protein